MQHHAFWALPGRRIEIGETSQHALVRELSEELGVTAQIGRLVWIVENRFGHGDRRFHEIGFYYSVELPKGACSVCAGEFVGAEPHLRLKWFSFDEISLVDLRPAFLRVRLTTLPQAIEHLQLEELP